MFTTLLFLLLRTMAPQPDMQVQHQHAPFRTAKRQSRSRRARTTEKNAQENSLRAARRWDIMREQENAAHDASNTCVRLDMPGKVRWYRRRRESTLWIPYDKAVVVTIEVIGARRTEHRGDGTHTHTCIRIRTRMHSNT